VPSPERIFEYCMPLMLQMYWVPGGLEPTLAV
jgi:hypothetical protein